MDDSKDTPVFCTACFRRNFLSWARHVHATWSGIAALGRGSPTILHGDIAFNILLDVLYPLRISAIVAKKCGKSYLLANVQSTETHTDKFTI